MNSNEVDFSSTQVKAYLIRTSIMHPVLEILGDPWNLTLVRSLLGSPKKFVSLTEELKISRAALSTRLNRLEQQGCVSRQQYCAYPPRYEYALTPMGSALQPTLLMLDQWNRDWQGTLDSAPLNTKCPCCREALVLTVVCNHCKQPLAYNNVKPLFFQSLPDDVPRQSYRRTRHTLASKDRSVDPETISAEEWLRDRWSSLIIGALLFGLRRFNDLQCILDIAPNILSGRLDLLLQAGMASRRDDGYRLLPRGAALYPIIITMSGWGRRWLPPEQQTEHGWRMLHISCGNWVSHGYVCQSCNADYP